MTPDLQIAVAVALLIGFVFGFAVGYGFRAFISYPTSQSRAARPTLVVDLDSPLSSRGQRRGIQGARFTTARLAKCRSGTAWAALWSAGLAWWRQSVGQSASHLDCGYLDCGAGVRSRTEGPIRATLDLEEAGLIGLAAEYVWLAGQRDMRDKSGF